ncbi:magnesium transporter MgtE N-terminal domain-containing protein [Pimelobacter simplex]|uniref:CBS domain-containing protein n=1 Tax=Nocardioides simplex TaxID=2045 RepID=A0A4Y3MUX7_NOCSI|nr:CBS domain-containing protein [Pimelobacter simplex]KAB2809176.1 CBS domain-containing protein [Pimelobacter simplex]MCG8151908.1 CBS domain-containing protein [Pimelobacter simplex]GEB12667.1 magnesium transporter [Pimelobacter simplex]SFM56112.1 Mg/Co/Ni transporter MgtE (contains CBS domain) [Pimelobacter simplex]
MSTTPSRVFAARLVGLPIFDPQGDQVGKVRDLVVTMRTEGTQPRVLGMVAEVFGRRRIFVPMTRVTNIDSGHVYTTGLLNMRRFEQRSTETLVIGQMLDRTVTITDSGITGTVYDVAMEPARTRDWVLSRVAVREPSKGFRRRGQSHVVEWRDVTGLTRSDDRQGATHLVAALNEMRPADAASILHDLPPERRTAVALALDDERLADVLEELPDDDQVEILKGLDSERAADVLEEMSPDDAADLVRDLPPETAEILLELMEPDEAEDVRRLLSYVEDTAGAMMTPEPVILGPDATIADALAHVRNPELTPALAALVYVCRPPLETPTGKLLGVAHIQRLLREPPSTLVAGALDDSMEWLRPEASIDEVAAHLATYNLVAAPVIDENGRLLGAVTVDDLLDHMLPANWRDRARERGTGPR